MPHAMSAPGSFESSPLASTELQSQTSIDSTDLKDKSLNSSTALATAPMSPPIPSPEISQNEEASIPIVTTPITNQEQAEPETTEEEQSNPTVDSEILPDADAPVSEAVTTALVDDKVSNSINSESVAPENEGSKTTTIEEPALPAETSTIDNSNTSNEKPSPVVNTTKEGTDTVMTEDSTTNQEENKVAETEININNTVAENQAEATTQSESTATTEAKPEVESATTTEPSLAEVIRPVVIKPELPLDSQLLNPEMNAPEGSPKGLAKHQLKFALAAIRSLKRLKDAGPFLHPVDAVKLNIPTYHEIIKNPMDISTMEKKLNSGSYETVAEFGIDMEYIVANCMAFNGPESFIANMARSIKASFDKHMQNMPLYELVTAASRKKKASTPVVANGSTSRAQKSVPLSDNSGLEIKSETGRPRREIHPPKPKDLSYSDMKPRNKRFAAELRFCSQVLKELYSKKHKSIAFAFLQPVDPVALDCPTYFDIVKKPMDLGTVTQKLNNNQYENGDEFRDDVKLIFENCYAFNPKGSPVNIMGHQLEAIFDKKWEEKPIYQPTPPPASSPHGDESDSDQSESGRSDEDSESDESDDEEAVAAATNPAIAFLEQQLDRMKQDLLKMKKEAAKDARKAAKALAKKRKSKKSSDKRKTTKRRRRSSATKNEPMVISYEMQQELARKIYTLDEQKTAHVINIIHQSMPELSNNGQGEIELDMDLLDRNTLEKLYKFVVLEGKKLNISSSSFNANSSKSSSKAKTTKKRSKSLTEAEQAKQIEDIQKKIKQFDHNGNENNAESSNEESSDDDSDESSSEEE